MPEKWYAGVTHAHTIVSDGALTRRELIKLAQKNKLDFLMITDHNTNCKEQLQKVDGLTLIYGTELTRHGGHANIWGVQNAVDDFSFESYEDFLRVKTEAQRRGALVCMNHPHCSRCTWRWEMNLADVDVLEIWNAPQHLDNMTCTAWWREQLKKGLKTPVVGGSDFHRDYYITNLLPVPVTYVFAKSSSAGDILAAIKAGHTTIASGVGKTMIEITSGSSILGDTVTLRDNTSVTVKVKKLHRKHSLIVYDADGEMYSHTAKSSGDFTVTLRVKKTGFITAEVRHKLGAIYKIGYNKIIGDRIPAQKNIKLPPFIYAQSGAMFFE